MQTLRLRRCLQGFYPSCVIATRQSSTKNVNYYSVLGVKFNVEQKEVKDSFYKLSKEFHPDLNKDNEAALAKFKALAEAYETLSNPGKRKEYDQVMGFGKQRNTVGHSEGVGRGHGRKFTGMKGVFKDGR